MVKDILRDLEKKFKASLDHFRKDLSKLRTGRANLSIFEDIKVDYYGVPTPVNQMAKIGIPDPSLITVQTYDASFLEAVDKAVKAAGLGLNPINDGKVLKIPIPPLDEERRREIVKHVKKLLEDEKTALRNLRREAKEFIEELEKEKEITEDDKFKGLEELQKTTDSFIEETESAAETKEKEIMQI